MMTQQATPFSTNTTQQVASPNSSSSFSYLNNDGIDELVPTPRKKRVSSLSLSDQWGGGLQPLTKINGPSGSLSRSGSMSRSGSISRSGSMSQKNSHPNLTGLRPSKSGSKLSLNGLAKSNSKMSMVSLNSATSVRYKKEIVDHTRIASYAFAFDIDGVIVRGPETIPEAREAIKMLNGENEYNIKVPYIFVTNGGGKPESARAADLSERLNTEITIEQIIQGHTPMRDLVDVYKNVLVVGGIGDVCRKVAEGYGFENVYIPLDVMYWNPSVTPYYNLSEEEKEVCKKDVDFSKTKIDAILVFADSRNWAADQQIILELLLSNNGYMCTTSETFDNGPPLYFAHSDFVWATNYKLSRYGMGALQVSIAALYREQTGKELKVTRFGKPQRGTFKYASKVLSNWRKDVLEEYVEEISINGSDSASNLGAVKDDEDRDDEDEDEQFLEFGFSKTGKHAEEKQKAKTANKPVFVDSEDEDDDEDDEEGLTIQKLSQLTLELPPASTVYFVGDTPESDIRFANSHDESWHSILVKTGVYKEGTIPKYKPKHTCENVLEAVKYAIEREHALELKEWNDSAIEQPIVEVPIVKEELEIVEKHN
ncbi:catalytic activity protein [[Candida] boidinii]|nr:catalytic activity protein [[Candida] boidinii]